MELTTPDGEDLKWERYGALNDPAWAPTYRWILRGQPVLPERGCWVYRVRTAHG